MKQYVVCITLKSTGSRRNQLPHFILVFITRCPALFSRIFFPAFYPLSLPHPALPLFTHSHKLRVWLSASPDRTGQHRTHTGLHWARTRPEMTDYLALMTVTSIIKA